MSEANPPLAPEGLHLFKDAMASFPSGVTIVTTADPSGRWWGFTATSFCSVSMEPPLVLVCLATGAECASVFRRATRWIVHVIHPEHAELAIRFATRGADKFADAGFVADENGLPVLDVASVILDCSVDDRHPAGDHTILVGQVQNVRTGPDTPGRVLPARVPPPARRQRSVGRRPPWCNHREGTMDAVSEQAS